MADSGTKVLTAHVPLALAERIDYMAERLDRSRGWIVKQALAAWLDQEQERERLTREAMADAESGNLVDHEAVQAWVDSFDSGNPLPVPGNAT